MHDNAFKIKGEGYRLGRVLSAAGMSLVLLVGQTAPLLGNPTGGTVVAGAATIGPAGLTLSIHQSTQNAIINWQQFSIAGGETTKFIVPSNGATLNRVTGGNPSAIYGNLQSNGTLYLVNPSGIVVGPGGRINTAGFLASTLDVSNEQFLNGGKLEFAGSSDAAVENDGVINASTGDVYLIASHVTNTGTLSAPEGTVGLAAASDVLFQPAGSQLFVQATPAGARRALGVTNSGTIRAAAAELKAAGGNAYALAINNTGVIAATGYKKINGQVYLTSDGGSISNSGKISAKQANGNGGKIVVDATAVVSTVSGTVTNSGTLDASATVAAGQGGTVTLRNMGGATNFSGKILAKGGQGGTGGLVEVSGGTLHFAGLVDVTAPGGTTGTLLLDPATLNVVSGGTGTVTGGENDSTSSTIDPGTVETALATANLVLYADTSVTISSGITWTSTNTLTLSTSGSIVISAPVSGVNGGLTISAGTGIGDTAAVDVAAFILTSGTWTQSAANLPAFTASHDFELQGGTFIRNAGLDAANGNAEEITDIYGLQGLGSPSGTQLGVNAELVNTINAFSTATWNSGLGFEPINNFTGTLNGQGYAVNSLSINQPDASAVGLFGTISGATLKNIGIVNATVLGGTTYAGALVGLSENGSTVDHSYSSGTVSNNSYSWVGGLVGFNADSLVELCQSSASVTGGRVAGGLVGENDPDVDDAAFTVVESSSSSGTVSGTSFAGGLVGGNYGEIENSFSTASVYSSDGYSGGLSATIEAGSISDSYSTGAVTGLNPGGLVGGLDYGTATDCFWDTQTSGQTNGVSGGALSGATGETTAQLLMASNYPNYDFVHVWTTNGDTTTPQLIGVAVGGGSPPPPPPPPPPPVTTPPSTPAPTPIPASQPVENSVAVVTPQVDNVAANVAANAVADAAADEAANTPPFNFAGNGIAEGIGEENGGLADATGNGGQVGAGDAAQLGHGQLNSVANPQAAGALNEALGPIVYANLADALKDLGDWADVPDSTGGDTTGGGDGETILNGGDVAEVTSTGVKNIPLDQAPKQLQKAMNTDVLKGVGLGH